MINKRFVVHTGIALATMGLLSPGAVRAQDKIETIVVTAQKRAENMQEVPISVVAITAIELSKKGLSGLENLSYATP